MVVVTWRGQSECGLAASTLTVAEKNSVVAILTCKSLKLPISHKFESGFLKHSCTGMQLNRVAKAKTLAKN